MPGSATPTSGTRPCTPNARQLLGLTSSLQAAAGASPGTTWPGPVRPPGAGPRLHARHVSLHLEAGEGVLHTLPRGLGHFL